MAVRVVADSTSYLTEELCEEYSIGIVPLSVTLAGTQYADRCDDYAPFFAALEGGREFPTTSQPSVADLTAVIEPLVQEGHEVVGVFISSAMSGTYSTAVLARDTLLERYPDAVIRLVDSRSNCMELGLAAIAAAKAAKAGQPIGECVDAAMRTIERTRFLFVPHTLEYLRRGGRIGNAAALLGSLLQMRPILTVVDGQTDVFKKVRTKSRAVAEIVAAVASDAEAKGGLTDVIVHHIDDEAEGRELAAMLEEATGHAALLVPVGPAIGAHVGPSTVGVVYSTRELMRKSG